MTLTFPRYFDLAYRLSDDFYRFATGRVYTSGKQEGRLNNQIPAHFDIIRQVPYFGTGARMEYYYSMKFEESDYEVADLPLTGHLALFGVAGLLVYMLFYFQFIAIYLRVSRFVKKRMSRVYLQRHRMELAMLFMVFAFLLKTFLFRPNYLLRSWIMGG